MSVMSREGISPRWAKNPMLQRFFAQLWALPRSKTICASPAHGIFLHTAPSRIWAEAVAPSSPQSSPPLLDLRGMLVDRQESIDDARPRFRRRI